MDGCHWGWNGEWDGEVDQGFVVGIHGGRAGGEQHAWTGWNLEGVFSCSVESSWTSIVVCIRNALESTRHFWVNCG